MLFQGEGGGGLKSSSNKGKTQKKVKRNLCTYMYSRRQKNVSIFFRRTVKVRSVPFPFYGAFYGKRTVKVR